jgi:PAS domain-containing protein
MDSDLERIGKSFEMSPHATVICNNKGIIVYANRAAARIYPALIKRGDRSQWAEGIVVLNLDSGERVPKSGYPMARALAGKVTKEMKAEVRESIKGQTYKVSIDAHPIKDDSGAIVGGISIHRLIE